MTTETKLNQGTIDSICKYLREGNYIETACECSGVSDRTFRYWRQLGEEALERGESEEGNSYIAVVAAVKKAQSEGQKDLLALIRAAATKTDNKSWQAAAWMLERTQPDKYGQKTRTDVTVREPVQVEFKIIDSKT